MALPIEQWRGHDLPEGLTVAKAEAAERLIASYEAADFDNIPIDQVMTREDLVIQLYGALCGPLG